MQNDIFKIGDYQSFDSPTLRKISLEYDLSQDVFSLDLKDLSRITPEEASTIAALIIEGQRFRAEHFKGGLDEGSL